MSNLANGSDITALAASKLTGALPAIDGSALTGLPGGAGVELIGRYTSSTTVSLSAGTYLLVPAGGGGGSSYQGTATSGGTSSIALDGFTAYGKGGVKGGGDHQTGGSAGGSGGRGHSSDGTGSYDSFYYPTIPTVSMFGGTGHPGNYGALPGNTGTDQYKTITTTQTATITVGAGGSLGGNGTYASAGTAGWCAIWKIT